jgi:CspA family cold shock protein
MLYYAAIPHTYDIAVVVLGDQDFKPVLQHARRLGKRVAIASINGSCAPEYHDRVPIEDEPVKDFDIVWFDSLLHRLELKYERHLLICESPIHKGRREVWTTFHPRRGQKFFCDECRAEFQRQKREVISQFVDTRPEMEGDALAENGDESPVYSSRRLIGTIKRLFPQKAFGFITGRDGRDYFFHLTDLHGIEFGELAEGDLVDFEIEKQPSGDKAGSAQNISLHIEEEEEEEYSEAEE